MAFALMGFYFFPHESSSVDLPSQLCPRVELASQCSGWELFQLTLLGELVRPSLHCVCNWGVDWGSLNCSPRIIAYWSRLEGEEKLTLLVSLSAGTKGIGL